LCSIRVGKLSNETFQVFLPDNPKIVANLIELKNILKSNGMHEDRYPTFESELLSKGEASVRVNYGGRQVAQY
jgi:hypothetical protein